MLIALCVAVWVVEVDEPIIMGAFPVVNDEIATVGIDQLELEDGMKLTFKELTTLDVTDQKVDQLIQSFID